MTDIAVSETEMALRRIEVEMARCDSYIRKAMPQGQNDIGKGDEFEEPRRSLEFERFPKVIREALHGAPADLTIMGVRNALLGHYSDQPYIDELATKIRNWKPKPGSGKLLGFRADASHDSQGWRAQVMALTEYGEVESYLGPAAASEEEARQQAQQVADQRARYFNLTAA